MLVRAYILLFCFSNLSFADFSFSKEVEIIEHTNIAYGENLKHSLDVVSSENCIGSPILLFVHGGSWRWGQKDYHRAIGKQFARNGVVFVSINYRLYPEVRFPEFPRDLARAIFWVRQNVERFGGNKKKIFLIGHSAGAHNACLVAMDEKYLNEFGGNLNWIKGVIPMACPFEFDPTKEFLYRDLFPNEKDINTLMPMGIEIKNKLPPFFIMHGKFDPILPENQVYEFAEKIKDFGGEAEVRIYSSHGHFSLVRRTTSWHIWPFPLLKDILNFIRSNE